MGKIVTFYSYSNGVGQSMALANTATLLTRWGYRTLVIDWDLEAPGGLEYFFEGHPISPKLSEQGGIIDLLSAAVEATSSDSANGKENPTKDLWRKYVATVDLRVGDSLQGDGKLDLLRAGRWDTIDYSAKLHSFNVSEFYASHAGGEFVEQLRNEWKASYDYVLIDCRAGITAFGSVCTIQMPDILLLLIPSDEHVMKRAVVVAKQIKNARHQIPFDRLELITIPVLARFDYELPAVGFDQRSTWFPQFEDRVVGFYRDWLPKNSLPRDMLADTMLPYQAKLSFESDRLPALRRKVPVWTGVGKGYESIAALLANDLQEANRLHTDRDGYVSQAWKNITLPQKLTLHDEWLKTNGESGKQANLSGGDYRGLNLVKAHLSRAILIKADFRTTNFLGADIDHADLSEANLEKANLKEVNGAGASFREANLREAWLTKADLSGADLRAARLNKADLSETKLYKATLRKASLEGVTGLKTAQFKGADLADAELPEKLGGFSKLRLAKQRSIAARVLFYALAIFCIYSLNTLFRTDDTQLLINGTVGFMGSGALLLILYIFFLFVIQSLWNILVELPATFPDGLSLNEKISDWFIAAVAYPYLAARVGRVPKWQRLALSVIIIGLVPATQLLIWWKVLPLRNWWLITIQGVFVALTVTFCVWFRQKGKRTLQQNNTGEHWQEEQAHELSQIDKAA
jgi:uncharacterized protein YjbI with pentapeptide repeats